MKLSFLLVSVLTLSPFISNSLSAQMIPPGTMQTVVDNYLIDRLYTQSALGNLGAAQQAARAVISGNPAMAGTVSGVLLSSPAQVAAASGVVGATAATVGVVAAGAVIGTKAAETAFTAVTGDSSDQYYQYYGEGFLNPIDGIVGIWYLVTH